jgi:biopolymer transport protein ExbB
MNVLVTQVIETAGRLALAAADKAPAATADKPVADNSAPPMPDPQAAAKALPGQTADAAPASAPAGAASDSSTAAIKQPAWYQSGAMGYMIDGGLFMWPILFMGILAAGVSIERWRSLKLLNIDTTKLRSRVRELLQNDRGEEALELCLSQQGPVPAVLSAGIRKFLLLRRLNYDPAQIEEQVDKAMEDYSVHIVAALERHLPILATISSVAPMVGSVGTVLGMIILFGDIVAKYGTINIIMAAAAGIKLKLLVTVWGLIVGIPAYVAYNYFTTVINGYVLNVEESATELMEAVTLEMSINERVAASSANGASDGAGATSSVGQPLAIGARTKAQS